MSQLHSLDPRYVTASLKLLTEHWQDPANHVSVLEYGGLLRPGYWAKQWVVIGFVETCYSFDTVVRSGE